MWYLDIYNKETNEFLFSLNTNNIELFKESFKVKDDKYCIYYKESKLKC